jgi:hypothetical protein
MSLPEADRSMRTCIGPDVLLALWEAALGQPAGDRDDALLRGWFKHVEPVRTLGERNARLMELHARLFEREIELLSHCPACGTAVQFSADCGSLAEQMQPRLDESPHRLDVQGHVIEFRLPDRDDIAIASGEESDDDFAQRLLDRCVLACTHEGEHFGARELPASVLDTLSQHMESLDPGASVSFAIECPQCAARWQAPLDVGDMIWQKVRAAAERVLLEIDALARAYGWTEREVLCLNPLRRAAYLQMVAA